MILKELLQTARLESTDTALAGLEVASVSCDSRTVESGGMFVALKGARYDGMDFVDDAIQRGAKVVVLSEAVALPQRNDAVFVRVPDPLQFLRQATRLIYGTASAKVSCIGVTGTNGKTTVTYLLESILKAAGQKCGVIGTVNYRIGEKVFPSPNTTLDFVANHRFLTELSRQGVGYCVMEVSSHGLHQGRVDLIDFKTAVFTNLTSDHLDYHKTRDDYFLAKAKLFMPLSPKSTAVINRDDAYGRKLIPLTKAKMISYGLEGEAAVRAEDITFDVKGSRFRLNAMGNPVDIRTSLVGVHNVYNILAAVAAGLAQGFDLNVIRKGVEQLAAVPGRLERFDSPKGFSVFIDYAHTEDALLRVLEALKALCRGRLLLVFGCGGDRDQTKRPKMGAVAARLADVIFVTNDNPRGEEPQKIVNQILEGLQGKDYQVVLDREAAIAAAIARAQAGDVVLLAGKGHENYQIFADKTVPFDEPQIIRKYLK